LIRTVAKNQFAASVIIVCLRILFLFSVYVRYNRIR